MPTSTWKANERSWKSIGARRSHFEQEDCQHSLFSIECKHRSRENYPARLRDWFEQARAGAPEGKVPLLAIHLAGEIRGNDLMILRRSDFESLLGRLLTPATEE
jgi:hypothetical protein